MTTKVSSRGQVVIPVAIRDALALREGQDLEIVTEGNRIILQPIAQRDWRKLRGAFGSSTQTGAEMIREARRKEQQHEERLFGRK